MTDHIINAELHLPQGEEMKATQVTGQTIHEKGKIKGTYNNNSMLNKLSYDVEFPDGEIYEFGMDIISKIMFSQVDTSRHHMTMLDSILTYKCDEKAVSKKDKFILTKQSHKHLHKTTEGFKFHVLWRDRSSQWVSLAKLKE